MNDIQMSSLHSERTKQTDLHEPPPINPMARSNENKGIITYLVIQSYHFVLYFDSLGLFSYSCSIVFLFSMCLII